MTTALVTHFQRLNAYESEANKRILAAIDTIPDSERRGDDYQRLCALIPHNQLARQVWLWRLAATPYDSPSDWFPAESTDAARARCERVDAVWAAYLATLTEPELARDVTYTNSSGKTFTSRVGDILTHVFNHSTYHRGQAARLITQRGGQRPVTDFIALAQRPLP